MSLFAKAEDALLASINSKGSLNFQKGSLLFGPGQRVEDVIPRPNTTRNSSVLIRSNDPRFGGTARINYNRLDFGVVFAHSALNTYAKLRAYRPATTHDLVPYLNDYYGINLTKADIQDSNLNLVDGAGSALIQANPDSLGWIGSFTVTIVPGDAKLSEWVLDTDLAGVQYPSGQTEKGQAEAYSYRYDASKYWPMLSEVVINNPDGITPPQTIIDMMVELTGHGWQGQTVGEYSLLGAKIMYNGPNDIAKPTNDRYSYITEIQLSAACSNLAGMLRFHYDGTNSIAEAMSVNSFDFELNSMSAFDPANADDPAYATDRHNPMLDTRFNDYTDVVTTLATIAWKATSAPATSTDIDKLVSSLRAKDSLPWNRTVGGDYSVADTWVAYNGPKANMPSSLLNGMTPEEFHRGDLSHVLVFFPPASQQANLWYGIGYMYYNA